MSDEQARPLDLDAVEGRIETMRTATTVTTWEAAAARVAEIDTTTLIAEVRALRAEQARLARDLAAARAALEEIQDKVFLHPSDLAREVYLVAGAAWQHLQRGQEAPG